MKLLRRALAIATLATCTVGVAAPAHAAVKNDACVTSMTTQVATVYAAAPHTDAALTPTSVTGEIHALCDLRMSIKTKRVATPTETVNGAHNAPGFYLNQTWALLCAGVPAGCAVWHAGMDIGFESYTAPWTCGSCNDAAWQGIDGATNTYLNPNIVGGTGFTVTETNSYWAGSNPAIYNEVSGQGNGPLTATATYTVSFLFYGFPISDSHWLTINCYPTGNTSLSYA